MESNTQKRTYLATRVEQSELNMQNIIKAPV